MNIDKPMIEDILASFFRRSEAATNAGGISMQDVVEGTPVPDGWRLDRELDFFLPPNVVLYSAQGNVVLARCRVGLHCAALPDLSTEGFAMTKNLEDWKPLELAAQLSERMADEGVECATTQTQGPRRRATGRDIAKAIRALARALAQEPTPAEAPKGDVRAMREALQEIERKYAAIMKDPPDWTNFTGPDDPRLKYAREAWYGASLIARKALSAPAPG